MAVYEGYCLSTAGSFVPVIPVHLQLPSSGLSWLEKLFGGKVCLWWLVVDTIVIWWSSYFMNFTVLVVPVF